MRKMYYFILLLCCFFTATKSYSQVTYTENFDGGLNGWTTVGGYNGATSTTNACSGSSLRFNLYDGGTSNNTTSPLLGTSNGGEITLSYAYKVIDFTGGAATPNPWGNIAVQYSTTATGPWTTVQTVNAGNHTSSAACAVKTANFVPSAGDFYLRFSSTWTDGDYYIHLDDISITQGAPPACMPPFNLAAPTVTASTAEVSWDPSSTPSASGYQWEIRTSGSAGSGATGLTTSGTTGAAVLGATVSSLSANTTYHLYVRTDCGAGSFSPWSGPYSFTTLCGSINAFPYTEQFNNAGLPACWTTALVSGTNNWVVGTTSPGGFGDIPAPFSGTRFIGKAYDNSNAHLISAPFDLASLGANQARISVYIYRHASTAAADVINFYINNTPSASGATNLMSIYPLTSVAPAEAASGWYKYKAEIPVSFNTAGPVYFIMEGITTAGFSSYDLGIEDFTVEQIPSCEEPTALIFSNVTTTSAQLEWTAPTATSPADYQVYHNTSPVAPTGSTTPTILNASSPATISSLSPGTKYYVWVRSNCGATDGVSIWSLRDSVTTECTPVTTLNENFDAVTTPALPACWDKFLRGAADATVTTSTGSVNSAPNGVFLSNNSASATADIMLVSPPLSNVGAGTHRLKFWARNGTATQDIEVGTLDNKSATATFTLVQAVDINGTYAEYMVDFTSYAGTDQYIAIRRLSTSTYTSVYLDNIVWEVIPVCDAPTLVNFPTIGNNSAEVQWTPPTLGSPVDYQIYYNTSPTAPTGASTPNVTGASFPATITGLSANTLYYVWVRTNCGAGGVSNWSNVASFTTACDPVSTLPWTENFDALTTVGTTNFPSCWKKENGDWATSDASFASQNDPRSTPNYLTNAWSATDEFMWTPGFQLTAGTSYDFSFWWTGDTYSGWTGDVFYNNTQHSTGATQLGSSFIVTATTSVAQYVQFKESFTPSSTGTYYFAIRINANSTPWYLGFDDFKLEVTPSCGEPTGVIPSNPTTTSIDVDWTAPVTGSPSNYQIYYNTTGTAPTASTTPLVTGITGTNANVTGLTPSTAYFLWVRSFCGGTDYSSWSSVAQFTTLCNAVTTFPYTQGFDATTLPACWSNEHVSATFNWTTVTQNQNNTIQPRTGARMAQFRTETFNGDKTKLVSPPLNLTSLTNPELVFWYANTQWSGDVDELRVFYKDGAGGTWTQLGSDYDTEQTAWTEVRLALPGASAEYYIAFEGTSNYGRGVNVDDVSIGEVSTLPVTLVDFRGEKAGSANKLFWTTSTEINNKGFELQRSADGRNFTALTFIASKAENGNSNATLNYSYNDLRPLSGNNYYRLKQIDKDGKTTYSDIVILKAKVTDITISSVYPNPASRELKMIITSPKAEKVTIVVTDLTGKVIMQQNVQLVIGDNQSRMNVQQLAAGTYLIKAICANGCETAVQRFVKQ